MAIAARRASPVAAAAPFGPRADPERERLPQYCSRIPIGTYAPDARNADSIAQNSPAVHRKPLLRLRGEIPLGPLWAGCLRLRDRRRPGTEASMAHPKPSPETRDLADLARLVERMRAGERRAISRAVTELERFSAAAPGLLEAMRPHLGHAVVVGVTGPPGAGKSTLLNAYTRHLRSEGKSIGIVAVDPSSPISGGA